MDQQYMQIIQDLSEKVNALMAQREHQSTHQEQLMNVQALECDDPHIKTKAPMIEVESYPALIEAIPSMDEDFFRSPLEDEVRKDIIYECPKFISMNYQPPPLNDAAPPNAKKTDATLYSIQQSLAQLTRPLDHYIHEQLRQRRQVDPENDEYIVLVKTMRTMLAGLAS
ncbi:hypothetical protein AYI70_g9117, partial [Smittium culicis]